ncbi:MAG: outer membrane protein assembly factor BamD [Candidatus Rokubacteria bacterium]|nr:outer membrane protein assembly factor BamD [Candidatus Rokubacteria bacterium]
MVIHTCSRHPGARLGVLALAALPLLAGCSLFGSRPETLPPAAKLYEDGEREILKGRYDAARDSLQKVVERHPDSDLVPQARFLLGESYYREREYDKAIRELEAFMSLYPGHPIADFAQYRLARSYLDNMPALERDQAVTAKALAEFQKLVKQYPESRYAPDAIAKIEACRLRLAQKELWIADYYVRQGNLLAALRRYDMILKEYGRTAVAPQALFQKADALARLDRTEEAASTLRRLVDEFPASEWARRARQRQTSAITP